MALALEEDGRAGVVQNALYDYYWPGYEDSAPLGHNTVMPADRSRRACGSRRRSRVAADQLHGRRAACPITSRRSTFPIPGPAATGRCATSSTTTCRRCAGCSARRRDIARDLLRNFYRMGQHAGRARHEGRPVRVHHPARSVRSARRAQAASSCCSTARSRSSARWSRFASADTVYPAGTDIVLMAQPFRAYAKTLLEVQAVSGSPPAPGAAARSAVRRRRLDAAAADGRHGRSHRSVLSSRRRPRGSTARRFRRQRSGATCASRRYYVIDGRGNGASIAINRLLKTRRSTCRGSTAPARRCRATPIRPGAIVVTERQGRARQPSSAIARDLGLACHRIERPRRRRTRGRSAAPASASTSRGSRTSTKAGRGGCSSSTSSRSRRSPTPTSARRPAAALRRDRASRSGRRAHAQRSCAGHDAAQYVGGLGTDGRRHAASSSSTPAAR